MFQLIAEEAKLSVMNEALELEKKKRNQGLVPHDSVGRPLHNHRLVSALLSLVYFFSGYPYLHRRRVSKMPILTSQVLFSIVQRKQGI